MKVLKRPGIWVLLVTLACGLGLAFYQHYRQHAGGPFADAAAAAAKPGAIEIRKIELERDSGYGILSVTFSYDNTTGADVETAAPQNADAETRLVTVAGHKPDLFFLPGNFPPVLKAGEQSTVTLDYWVERAHLQGALHLEVKGERALVKDAKPFALDTVENHEKVSFTTPEWQS